MASIFDASRKRAQSFRAEAKRMRSERFRASPAAASGASNSFADGSSEFDDTARAGRQYHAFRDSVYTAIRPIMNLGASQPFRVGLDSKATQKSVPEIFTKDLSGRTATKALATNAPEFIKKSLTGGDVEALDDHILLKLLASPNEELSGFSLKQVSIASMILTGRFVWWIDSSGETREDAPELGSLRLWYVPRHWIRPSRSNAAQRTWYITTPGYGGSIEVTADQLFISTIPDPGNPMMPFSPVQSQASSIDTEDKILKAQATSMENTMRPNLIVSVGSLPGNATPPGVKSGAVGSNGKPILTPSQRQDFIDAFKRNFMGVEKTGEPIFLDGLIEAVTPFMTNPGELDFQASQSVTRERTMFGIGTSEVVAGQSQNANRAGSVVAQDIFNKITLNPVLQQISEDLDKRLAPRFSYGGGRLRAWIDLLEANDPAEVANRVNAVKPALKVGELRRYAETGKLVLDEIDEATSNKFMHEILPQKMESVPPGSEGSGKGDTPE